MPLTFPKRAPVEDFRAYTAAQVVSLTIDLVSKRIIGIVVYGDVVNGVFRQNKNVANKIITLDNAVFDELAAAVPNAQKTMYENIKEMFWNKAIDGGFESGVIS